MSATSDWRSQSIVDDYNRLERPGFAAEFLRRSPVYRADYARTLRRLTANATRLEDQVAALARRWGLSFPFRSSDAARPRPHPLAARIAADRCGARRDPGRLCGGAAP